MYVPIVRFTISPVQNALRPAIEKTDRSGCCPVYMVNLFKKKWGQTAVVSTSKVEGNNMWSVPQLPNMSAAQSEIIRLKSFFKDNGKAYERAYPDDDKFVEDFNAVAVEENPYEASIAERDEENREAAVKRATKAVMQAAGDAAVQARRKKGRPFGSKNKSPEAVEA